MAAPRRLVGRVARSAVCVAVVAGAATVARDQLIKRNTARYGPEPLRRS